ncbi:F-box protein PP2-B1-like [Nymphaea colorata]|nr:F-box protein PP2-B1-like [Nymphaea colorata]
MASNPPSSSASIADLPENCVSHVLSLMAPREVCRSSAISTSFQSAANSDYVWEKVLPPDLPELLSRAVSPDKGKEVAASQGNELVVWEGATEHGESSPREQHGSSTQTYLPLDYDYAPRLQPCACAAGDKRKSCDDSEGDDHSGGSAHQERKGCGGWLSDED